MPIPTRYELAIEAIEKLKEYIDTDPMVYDPRVVLAEAQRALESLCALEWDFDYHGEGTPKSRRKLEAALAEWHKRHERFFNQVRGIYSRWNDIVSMIETINKALGPLKSLSEAADAIERRINKALE